MENRELSFHQSDEVPGLDFIDLVVLGDSRGSFKEAFQREKLLGLGAEFPEDFEIVQQNISVNEQRGVTRGIHAEPWDKYITVAYGEIFVALVDLREGENFGKYETATLGVGDAFFVPKGVGNSFQTQSDLVVYSYLVNDHWSEEKQKLYTMCNLADPDLNIDWPIPLDEAIISEKDQNEVMLGDVTPFSS